MEEELSDELYSFSAASPFIHIPLIQPYCTECPRENREVWSPNNLSSPPPPPSAFLLPFLLCIVLISTGQNKCSFGTSSSDLPQHAQSATQTWGTGLREELNYISIIFFFFLNSQVLPLQVDGRREAHVFQMFSTTTLRVNCFFFFFF